MATKNNSMDEELNEENNGMPPIPENVRIISFQADPRLMLDFQDRVKELNGKPYEAEVLEQDWATIEDENEFKDTLVKAAFLGSVEVFRKLEALEVADENRQSWVELSTLYARMIMEQDLLDEPLSFIVTGLGGEGNRIRYCFVLRSNQLLTESLAGLVGSEYEELAKYYDVTWEDSVYYTPEYIRFTLLVPFDYNPNEMIEEGINKLTFLDKEYIASNMKIPEEEELVNWLKKKED